MIRTICLAFLTSIVLNVQECTKNKPTPPPPPPPPMVSDTVENEENLVRMPSPPPGQKPPKIIETPSPPPPPKQMEQMKLGIERSDIYMQHLRGKRIACAVNQTSMIDGTHVVDFLLQNSLSIQKIFAPEHGFRGDADAGEKVADGKDIATGLPIVSLYGSHKKPTAADLSDVDGVLFDIQDVGARFYTYISTLYYIMEACAENNKPLIIFDRPNPNGHYVDGPVLEASQKSFVGIAPIPIVHGLTIGEFALMANGEGWLSGRRKCELYVIPCSNYDHNTIYNLPVNPSPNLTTMKAIYLYPSLCLFEGTTISVGRGTAISFCCYGSPDIKECPYNFVPTPNYGNKAPMYQGKVCYGYDLSSIDEMTLYYKRKLDLSYIINLYNNFPSKDKFFLKTTFFDQLAGTAKLKQQIINGMTEEQIRASWEPALSNYKAARKKYLLYPDFE